MNKKKFFGIIGFVVLILAIFIGPIVTRFPIPQADRIDGGNLVGIEAGGSFAWIIPTQSGVVLVDAGWDVTATALQEEVAGRTVHAIFITHGHFDHTGALPLYPDATVYIGQREGPLLRGEVAPQGWMANMSTSMMAPAPYTPPNLTTINDGETIEIDGETFITLNTPGHTSGSAMYIWEDVLFSGDSIVGRGSYVNEVPQATADDYDDIRGSVAQVLTYSFDRLADGHVGLHQDAYQQVVSYVGE
jgi:glyoxylase-like metal-dependent hydrolase (beta-lactamase superfamily II)